MASDMNSRNRERASVHAPSTYDGTIDVEIRPICAHETLPLRSEVLRITGKRLNFEEDYRESVIHLGAHVNDELVGIATVFKERIGDIEAKENPVTHLPISEGDVQWRFRGFAIASKMQKKGVGKTLLDACIRYIREQGGRFVWCHARISVLLFYVKQGFGLTGDTFFVEEAGMHRYAFKHL